MSIYEIGGVVLLFLTVGGFGTLWWVYNNQPYADGVFAAFSAFFSTLALLLSFALFVLIIAKMVSMAQGQPINLLQRFSTPTFVSPSSDCQEVGRTIDDVGKRSSNGGGNAPYDDEVTSPVEDKFPMQEETELKEKSVVDGPVPPP